MQDGGIVIVVLLTLCDQNYDKKFAEFLNHHVYLPNDKILRVDYQLGDDVIIIPFNVPLYSS